MALSGKTYSIRIGGRYQAVIPSFHTNFSDIEDKETIERQLETPLWIPDSRVSDDTLDEFLQETKNKYGYSTEQSLAMLMWNKYDLEKALTDMRNFKPAVRNDVWCDDDRAAFSRGFERFGTDLRLIQKCELPRKSMEELIEYFHNPTTVFPEKKTRDCKRTTRRSYEEVSKKQKLD